MVKFKKNAHIALSAVVFGSAAYVGYREAMNDEASDLLLANVEALTDGEPVSDTGPGDTFKCEHCGVRVKKIVSVRTFILVRQICVAATIDVGVSTDFVKRNSVMCKIS